MSSARSVDDALARYLAGRLTAPQLVQVVAAAYYMEQGPRRREQLQPVMEVIERAHPGIVTLAASAERPGFAVGLESRPFPSSYDDALRAAVQRVMSEGGRAAPSVWSRVYGLIRKLFTASP